MLEKNNPKSARLFQPKGEDARVPRIKDKSQRLASVQSARDRGDIRIEPNLILNYFNDSSLYSTDAGFYSSTFISAFL